MPSRNQRFRGSSVDEHCYHEHAPRKDWSDDRTLPLGIRLHGGEKLHSYGYKGQGIRVGVLDTGVDERYTLWNGKLKNQTWYRYGEDLAETPHGTHVAGTIHMMAPEAEIYDYRVFGNTGVNDVNLGIANAIIQAYLDGCQVLNLSLGTETPDLEIITACNYVCKKGVIMICAAGNEGDDNVMTNEFCYPAPLEETIAIAAVAKKDGLPHAYFSDSNPQVDYAALGWQIKSFKAGTKTEYTEMSGTSMACPHISGMVACLLSNGSPHRETVFQHKSPMAVSTMKQILADKYCVDIGARGFDNDTGLGFLSYLTLDEFNTQFRSEHIQLQDASSYNYGGSGGGQSRGSNRTNVRRKRSATRYTRRAAATKSIDIIDGDATGLKVEYPEDGHERWV